MANTRNKREEIPAKASGGDGTRNPWDKAKDKNVRQTHDSGDQAPKQRRTNEEDEHAEPKDARIGDNNERHEGDVQKTDNS